MLSGIMQRGRTTAAALLLAALTVGLFLPAVDHGFIVFDDDAYVTENPRVLGGLTRDGLVWAFSETSRAGNWHPLTWLSHMLDVQLFGLDARGHHLANILFHAAGSVVLFLLLRSLTGDGGRSLLVAFLFAAHPLHVESVAWVAERKDVLSAFLWLLTMAAYLRYLRRPGPGRYAAVTLIFALGLMAKPMLVTLPLVLLVLDWWPLGRLGSRSEAKSGMDGNRGTSPLLPWVEKAPLLLMSLGSAVLAYHAQQSTGAVDLGGGFPLGTRVANALVAAAVYLRKMVFPVDLAVFYPHPGSGLAAWKWLAAALFLLLCSLGVAAARRRRPCLAFGWLWYLVTLLPVAGLVQVGYQAMADRYTYLPLVGIFVAIAWGLPDTRAGFPRAARLAVVGVTVAACLLLTRRQLATWRDSETLFTHALTVTDGNWMAHNVVGNALLDRGDPAAAERHYLAAVTIRPDYEIALYNLGNSRLGQGKRSEAIEAYRRALRVNPAAARSWNNLGSALLLSGDAPEAIACYERALALDPHHKDARSNVELARAQLRSAPAVPPPGSGIRVP